MKLALISLIAFLFLVPASAHSQSCLTPDDLKKLLSQANSKTSLTLNKKLQAELVKLAAKYQEILLDAVKDGAKQSTADKLKKVKEQDGVRICEILKTSGWPTSDLVGRDGVLAAFYLLRNAGSFEMQRDLLPVLIATSQKDSDQKADIANIFDRLCIAAGLKQRFGTQAASKNGFLILYPIEDEQHVDQRRQQIGLPPLSAHIKNLEETYRLPLVRARQLPESDLSAQLKNSLKNTVEGTGLDSTELSEDEIVRVDTNLVSLNVSVFNDKSKMFVGALSQDEFKVLENGQEQTVSYFASTSVPFDLVLLIDLSGSTYDKRELIRKSTLRFIEAARPTDRVAIVTFADEPTMLSPLTLNRDQLKASVEKFPGAGGSSVWDSVKFALDHVVERKPDRRRAIVLMSDGVDNGLLDANSPIGSKITFADLMRAIGQNDTLIVPIYLDTEADNSWGNDWSKLRYAAARKTLAAMAAESGGSYYHAKRLSDLEGVYEQVINDLGKVYSLGYKSTNDVRDGSWRTVEVQIVNKPDLKAHVRPGYYAQ